MIGIDLANLYCRRDAESRSLSAENFRGEKGAGAMATAATALHAGSARAARDLGPGWKLSPCIPIKAGETVAIMDHDGPGVIRHIWLTLDSKFYRNLIVRVYWDGDENPSVECPVGDFFCCSWKGWQRILAGPINVNPQRGMNCFFPMPFRQHAKITIQNDSPNDLTHFFYTINYTLETVAADALYLHAQFRRSNPVAYQREYLMIDGVRGNGHYVGTFMSWQQNSAGWWGEGEIKMYLDGDAEHPTICGTGTEDYFGGAWNFGGENFSAPCMGYQDVTATGEPGRKREQAGNRITLYRFHVHDPVFFKRDLRITMQCLGWRSEGRYLPLQDDVASVVYWYQSMPHAPFPTLADRDAREII